MSKAEIVYHETFMCPNCNKEFTLNFGKNVTVIGCHTCRCELCNTSFVASWTPRIQACTFDEAQGNVQKTEIKETFNQAVDHKEQLKMRNLQGVLYPNCTLNDKENITKEDFQNELLRIFGLLDWHEIAELICFALRLESKTKRG